MIDVVGMRLEPGITDAPAGVVVVDAEGVVVTVTLSTEGDRATAVGEQLRLVPGMVGSVAKGAGASVVAGAPGTVDGENRLTNGLGPPSGEETMAPGVDGIANWVVPMVDIWARHWLPPSRSAERLAKKTRISKLLRVTFLRSSAAATS